MKLFDNLNLNHVNTSIVMKLLLVLLFVIMIIHYFKKNNKIQENFYANKVLSFSEWKTEAKNKKVGSKTCNGWSYINTGQQRSQGLPNGVPPVYPSSNYYIEGVGCVKESNPALRKAYDKYVANPKGASPPKYLLHEEGKNECPTGYESVSKDECSTIGKSLLPSGKTMGRVLQAGDWGWVPPGCSLQSKGDWAPHFNNNSGAKNDGSYSKVCKKKDDNVINTYTFTNAGATGRLGPTKAQIDAAYRESNLKDKVNITKRGIQEWKVPVTGKYKIEAYGAQGGGSKNAGLGAKAVGIFDLKKNEILKIVVGQTGGAEIYSQGAAGGGGGGTYIVKILENNSPSALIVAGGGGGGGVRPPGGKSNGLKAGASPWNVRQKGEGNRAAGYTENGNIGLHKDGTIAMAFKNGAQGGKGASGGGTGYGGFGGGGGEGYNDGGGGGGWIGGGGGDRDGDTGLGGTSKNNGKLDSQINESGVNSGHGKVIITQMISAEEIKRREEEAKRKAEEARKKLEAERQARIDAAVAKAKKDVLDRAKVQSDAALAIALAKAKKDAEEKSRIARKEAQDKADKQCKNTQKLAKEASDKKLKQELEAARLRAELKAAQEKKKRDAELALLAKQEKDKREIEKAAAAAALKAAREKAAKEKEELMKVMKEKEEATKKALLAAAEKARKETEAKALAEKVKREEARALKAKEDVAKASLKDRAEKIKIARELEKVAREAASMARKAAEAAAANRQKILDAERARIEADNKAKAKLKEQMEAAKREKEKERELEYREQMEQAAKAKLLLLEKTADSRIKILEEKLKKQKEESIKRIDERVKDTKDALELEYKLRLSGEIDPSLCFKHNKLFEKKHLLITDQGCNIGKASKSTLSECRDKCIAEGTNCKAFVYRKTPYEENTCWLKKCDGNDRDEQIDIRRYGLTTLGDDGFQTWNRLQRGQEWDWKECDRGLANNQNEQMCPREIRIENENFVNYVKENTFKL